jgi:two-component system, NarL family, response regulator DegU
MPIRVLIADDHPIVRSGIRAELGIHEDIRVAGEATTGDETFLLARELQPDVILLDINMPGLRTTQLLKHLQALKPAPLVLILTAFGDQEYVLEMLKAGVRGYMLKDTDPSQIVTGIRKVAEGKTWFGPAVIDVLLENLHGETPDVMEEVLTEREIEVLRLVRQGYSNKDIARQLAISLPTVRNHMTHIYRKLDLHTRAEAVAWAWRQGIV